MNKIIPNLWFDNQAEEAANFYVSVFKEGKVGNILHYTEVGKEIHGQEPGSVMTVDFELFGQQFSGLNGGPVFKFTPAISFMLNCESKEEVDEFWQGLSQDSNKILMPLDKYDFSERYGWLEDKFGVSWQIGLFENSGEQKITPSLMFAGEKVGKAEEAINYYASVFKNAKVGSIFRYGPGQEPDEEDSVMYSEVTLEGQKFAAMDSAREHDFTFSEAISFIINCDTQEEVDYYWGKLSAVPESEQCGWVKDKFGVSWQIVPTRLNELLALPDEEKAKRVFAKMLKMKKLNIAELENS